MDDSGAAVAPLYCRYYAASGTTADTVKKQASERRSTSRNCYIYMGVPSDGRKRNQKQNNTVDLSPRLVIHTRMATIAAYLPTKR